MLYTIRGDKFLMPGEELKVFFFFHICELIFPQSFKMHCHLVLISAGFNNYNKNTANLLKWKLWFQFKKNLFLQIYYD